jgi:hypothetical protein
MKSWCIMGFQGQHFKNMYSKKEWCDVEAQYGYINGFFVIKLVQNSNHDSLHECHIQISIVNISVFFPPSTSYHLPPIRPLKNKTHTSRQWNNCWLTKHTSTFYLFTFHFPFQTFHIYSMHSFRVVAPLWSWIISRCLTELIHDNKSNG